VGLNMTIIKWFIQLAVKFLLLLILLSIDYQQAKSTNLNDQQIKRIAEAAIKEFQIPGVAIAVVKNHQVVHSQGYGSISIDSEQLVDEHTLFKIASNSKAFTSASLALLVQQGKLSWHDKVVTYLPNFKMYDEEVTKQFNIIDLLTHRSGLRIGAGDLMLWPEPTKFTRQNVVNNLRYLKPVSEFRKKYAYDNLLYIVAGEVMAAVSGMSWEDFVAQHIFKPLKMNRCFAGGVAKQHNHNSVAPHAIVNGRLTILEKNRINNQTSIMAAAGGIKCSVNDLSQWVSMLLADDSSSSLISQAQKRELWKPRTKLKLSNRMKEEDGSTYHSYGLGWRISDYHGVTRVSHTGMLGGSMSKIVLLPELNLGFVVLTNQQSSAGRRAIMRSLFDLYVDRSSAVKTDWIEKYSNSQSKSSSKSSKNNSSSLAKNKQPKKQVQLSVIENSSDKSLRERLGNYSDPWFGKVGLELNGNRISFTSDRSPRLTGDVFWYNKKRWWVRWHDRSFKADAWIDFKLGSTGQVIKMTMKPISSKTDFSFDFEDLNFSPLAGNTSNE
jgi:CubicO group peptidase (beta-lactamase class C family)